MPRSESPLPLETSEVLSPSHHCFGPSRVEAWTVHVPWSWICWPSVQIVMSTTTAVHLGVEKFDKTLEAWHQMDFSDFSLFCSYMSIEGFAWSWVGCSKDAMFTRHPDLILRLCNDASTLLWTLFDGLVWRHRRGRETQESAHADSWRILCRYMCLTQLEFILISCECMWMQRRFRAVTDRACWFSHHLIRGPMIHNLRHEQALAKKIEHPL